MKILKSEMPGREVLINVVWEATGAEVKPNLTANGDLGGWK